MNSRALIKDLEADGWYLVNVRGSHHYYKHPTKPGKVTIPHPKKAFHPVLFVQYAPRHSFNSGGIYEISNCDRTW